jgi:hypothetical protein
LLNPGLEVAPLDELGDDVTQAILGAAYVVDRDDVGVIQAGQDAGFGEVSLDSFGLRNPMAVRHLNGHLAPQLLIITLINQPEAAFAERPDNSVAAQTNGRRRLLGRRPFRSRADRLVGRLGLVPGFRGLLPERRLDHLGVVREALAVLF